MTTAWLLGLILTSQGSLPTSPVTFSNPGQPLGGLIPLLSKEAGVSLAVADAMRNDVLVIHADGVPLDKVMKHIATASEGTWAASGNSWTLVPDNNIRELARRQRRAERMKMFAKDIDEYLKPEPRGKNESEEDYMDRAIPPESTAMMHIVKQIDLGVLVDIGDGQRVVFSTQPTRMQRAFSPNVAALQTIIAEHNKQVSQSNQSPRENPTDEQLARNPYLRRYMERERLVAINEPPAKILLVAERGSEMFGYSALSLSLKLYSRDGKVVLRESTSLSGEDFDWEKWQEEEENEADPKPAPKDDSPKLVLSAAGKEFAKLTRGMEAMMGGNFSFSDELRAMVSRPHEHEPLAYMLGDYLVQVAKHKKAVLVANLPDSAIESSSLVSETTTVNRLFAAVSEDDNIEVTEADGVITICPANGDLCRSTRTDRTALARLLASAKGRSIPLIALAEFATKSPALTFDSQVALLPIMIVAPGVLRSAYDPKAWQGLALYGSLTSLQRQGLDSGGQLNLGTLTPVQLGYTNRLVYGAEPAILLDGDEPAEDEMFGGMMGMMMRGLGGLSDDSDYRQEPTEIAPNGLVGPGFIHAKIASDVVFEPTGSSSSLSMMMMGLAGPEELAMFQMMREAGGAEAAMYLPDLKEFRIGQRKMIDLRVQLAPAASTRTALFDESVPQDGPKYTMESLPAEVKARLEKAREAMNKIGMGELGYLGSTRRRVPPP